MVIYSLTEAMINDKLINPSSIVVVGGSDDLFKPGGKVLKNILDGKFCGSLMVVNPKHDLVQGVKSYKDVALIPDADLAILAIPAGLCLNVVRILVETKNTKAIIKQFILRSNIFSNVISVKKTNKKKYVKKVFVNIFIIIN